MDLKKLRNKIDALDKEVVGLLNDRAKLTSEIGAIKAGKGDAVYVPDREMDVYEKVLAANKGPLSDKALLAVYREVMSGCLELEKPLTIAYFGPEFTNTHIASMKKFGSSASYTACATIKDVFSEVEKERADHGVVPIENSIEGAVNHTLDMFVDSDLKICSEVYLEISHNLLSLEKDTARIKRIYSNPQVFGQCRLWLESHMPHAELIEISSTAKAAEVASRERGSACLASILAGKKHGLNLLYRSIEDSAHNMTRFLVVGKTLARPTAKDKTSLVVSVKDKVGGLHSMLLPFKKHSINLTKIESRPSKSRAWEYYFFVDLEGHSEDVKVKRAIAELQKVSTLVKLLGSYPVGKVI